METLIYRHDQSKLLDDLIVEVDNEYRSSIIAAQREKMGIGQVRKGTHVSDLLMCIRKSWLERYSDYVYDPPDTVVLTWMRGLSHEDLTAEIIQQVRVGYCFRCDQMCTWRPELETCPQCRQEELMIGTVDWVTLDGDELDYSPVEMKSTLKSAKKTLLDMAWYADQCKTYMAIHKKEKGRVGVFHIMGDYKRDNPDEMSQGPKAILVVYRIQWQSEDNRTLWLQTLQRRKQKLEDPSQVPALDEDSPGRHPFICSYCVVGERMPNGQECEMWPYRKLQDGTYVTKGSQKRDMSIEDMMNELSEMTKEVTDV